MMYPLLQLFTALNMSSLIPCSKGNSTPTTVATATCLPNVCQACRSSSEIAAATDGLLDDGETEKSQSMESSCSNDNGVNSKLKY